MSHFPAHSSAYLHARTHIHTLIHTHIDMREYNRANADSYLHTGHVTDISGMHFSFRRKHFLLEILL